MALVEESIGAILDTSFFIAREQRRPLNAILLPKVLAVSVVTLAELRLAVFNASDSGKQARCLDTLKQAMKIRPIGIDENVAFQWAALRSAARSGSQSRVKDLWIAATALVLQVPVVTQDDGFLRLEKVGGPKVIRV